MGNRMNSKRDSILRIFNEHKTTDMFIESIKRHKAQPEVSLSEYINTSRIKFGLEACSMPRIYLDTKYWIMLRDSCMSVNKDPDIKEIMERLSHLVNQNKIICPISPSIFFEILKQSDPDTKLATAKIVDSLSRGFTIINHYDILKNELIYFGKILKGEKISFEAHKITLWRKVGTILGDDNFIIKNTSLKIKKTFYDLLYKINFSDIIEILNSSPQQYNYDDELLSKKLNDGKISHEHENTSFKLLLAQELLSSVLGILEIFKDDKEIISELSNFQSNIDFKDIDKIFKQIPAFYSYASIHSAIRFDKKRNYKPNDFMDFIHAATAIPYYNIFLTENSLKHLLTTRPLKLDKEFKIEIYSYPNEANSFLKQNFS